MSHSDNNFCLILAGGLGGRLWPASREQRPKQYIDFAGIGRTLLQMAYDRFAAFLPEDHIYVSTQESYLPLLREQLPQLPMSQVLAEPVRRGTLAPVTWGTSAIAGICPDARIVVSPADQKIFDQDAFADDVLQSLEFVGQHEGVVTLGIQPTRPDTGYGYVQRGEPVDTDHQIFRVKTFTEKPNEEFARLFMESGEFLWNTGLFVFAADYMLQNIIKHVPEYRDEFPELANVGSSSTTDKAPRLYSALPNLSLEYALLEQTGHKYVRRCRFRWADLGTWKGIAEDITHNLRANIPHPGSDIKLDSSQNVVVHSDALFDNAHDNIVRLPFGHLAVISGLEGYVISEEDGVLMICPKNDDAAMRRLQTLAHLVPSATERVTSVRS
ncbi:MAG: mannose-1-phosphate guanylyltransferase [Bacteroidaceae bacterium]|nr:mannose-1-phosphate guanylyltransferase [Bacteroidaceae bacterium]